jgi:hypothetical protein
MGHVTSEVLCSSKYMWLVIYLLFKTFIVIYICDIFLLSLRPNKQNLAY